VTLKAAGNELLFSSAQEDLNLSPIDFEQKESVIARQEFINKMTIRSFV